MDRVNCGPLISISNMVIGYCVPNTIVGDVCRASGAIEFLRWRNGNA